MSESVEQPVSESSRASILEECQKRIDYRFDDVSILQRALTHSSCASTRLECNERMEFLGDAVLGMVICESLYERFPDQREGQLTQQKSHLVSRSVCTQVGHRLQLPQFIFVGKGLGRIPDSLSAAAVEAVIAAIYIDGGFSAARKFILNAFEPELSSSSGSDATNFKSTLQEETQKDGNSTTPSYVILEERGPDHAREFQVAVTIGEQQFEAAWGRSKKEAEQKAAMNALQAMDSDDS